MGVDPQLDDELSALAAANRRNADATELERLAESLTMAVRAVDAVSPVPTIVPKLENGVNSLSRKARNPIATAELESRTPGPETE